MLVLEVEVEEVLVELVLLDVLEVDVEDVDVEVVEAPMSAISPTASLYTRPTTTAEALLTVDWLIPLM